MLLHESSDTPTPGWVLELLKSNIHIIIMSCLKYRFPWLSLTSLFYRPSLSPGLLGYIFTEILSRSSSWASNTCLSVWSGQEEHVDYEFVLTSPAVSSMSCSSGLNGFRDGREVAVCLLVCGMLLPRLDHNSSQCSCAIAVKLFLYMICQKQCVLFYRTGLTSLQPVAYW